MRMGRTTCGVSYGQLVTSGPGIQSIDFPPSEVEASLYKCPNPQGCQHFLGSPHCNLQTFYHTFRSIGLLKHRDGSHSAFQMQVHPVQKHQCFKPDTIEISWLEPEKWSCSNSFSWGSMLNFGDLFKSQPLATRKNLTLDGNSCWVSQHRISYQFRSQSITSNIFTFTSLRDAIHLPVTSLVSLDI